MFKVRLSGVYQITHLPSGKFYIGESIDIYSRWASHHTSLSLNRHSSPLFQILWDNSTPKEWTWTIISIFSKTEFRLDSGLKGKKLELGFKQELRKLERQEMGIKDKSKSLNNNNKYFGEA